MDSTTETTESDESGIPAGTQIAYPWVSVPLSAQRSALISPEDAERVLLLRWHLWTHPKRPWAMYAKHTQRFGRNTKTFWLHRFVLGAADSTLKVDHIDGCGLDCRRHNLRIATTRQNAENLVYSPNRIRGGHKGVSWNKNAQKWEVSVASGEVQQNGKRKRVYLGLFADPAEAARAYDAEAVRVFGEFAALNFPGLRRAG